MKEILLMDLEMVTGLNMMIKEILYLKEVLVMDIEMARVNHILRVLYSIKGITQMDIKMVKV